MITGVLSNFLTKQVEPKLIFGTKVKVMYDNEVATNKKAAGKKFREKIGMSDSTMRRMFKGDITDEGMEEVAGLLGVEMEEMLTVQPSFLLLLCKKKALNDGKFSVMLLMLAAAVYAGLEAVIAGDSHFHFLMLAFICFALHNVGNVWVDLQFSKKDKKLIERSKYIGFIFMICAIIVSSI